jgi:hypothetical protein
MVRRSVFDQIFREMRKIRYRLDDIERSFSGWNPLPLEIPESDLFSLPDHIRKTYMIVASKGECNATEVSNITGRCRALESSYLNQLARMGWLMKRRDSKAIHFRPVSRMALREHNDGSAKKAIHSLSMREKALRTQSQNGSARAGIWSGTAGPKSQNA